MTALLPGIAILVPLLLGLAALVPRLRPALAAIAWAAPLPALAAAFGGEPAAELSGIVTGIEIGLDDLSPPFLALTAICWMAAGAQARLDRPLVEGEHAPLFLPSFLLAMAGNIGVTVALDPVGFYLFFTLLTLGSYGIVLSGGPEARGPAALFLGLSLVGEMAMLAGFMGHAAGGLAAFTIAALLFFGLGVKHAVVPLHVWAPPAYGATPIAGLAALGGALGKVGLLGWLRFLPEMAGEEGLSSLIPLMASLGLAGAFLGAAAGLFQTRPRTALAYSSISQLGLATGATALAAASLEDWRKIVPVLTLFALHHALAKGALFLTVQGSREGPAGRLIFPVQIALSLAIAAFPLTGGALFKLWLEEEAHAGGDPWLHAFEVLLPYISVGSALVLARFLWLVRPGTTPSVGQVSPWPALLLAAAALAGPWVLAAVSHGSPVELAVGAKPIWKTFWPAGLGIAIALAAVLAAHYGARMPRAVPPGDLAVWLPALARRLPVDPTGLRRCGADALTHGQDFAARRTRSATRRVGHAGRRGERGLRGLPAIGGIFAAILLALLVGAIGGG